MAAPGGARGADASPPARRARPRGNPRALLPRSVHSGGARPRGRYHAVGPVAGTDHHESRPARELPRSHARGGRSGRPPVEGQHVGVDGRALRVLRGPRGHGQLARLALVLPGLDRRRDLDAADRHLRPAGLGGRGKDPRIVRAAAARAIPGARRAGHRRLGGRPDPGPPPGLPGSLSARATVLHPRESFVCCAPGRPAPRGRPGPHPVSHGGHDRCRDPDAGPRGGDSVGLRLPSREPLLDLGGPAHGAELSGQPGAAARQQRARPAPGGRGRRARRGAGRAWAHGRHDAGERRDAARELRPRRLGRRRRPLLVRARIPDARRDRGPERRDDRDPRRGARSRRRC